LGENKRGPPTHAYFILHDRIYQAPNLYDVMQTRLRNATWSLQKTFAMLERARPAANPRATGNWVAVARDGKEKKKDDKDDGKDETKEEGKEEDKDAAGLGDDAPAQAGPAGTNWHLLHALASTQAALTDIDKLAAAPAPAFDEVAEARALEAMATAAIRGPAAAAAAAAAAVAATGAPAPSVAPPVPTRAPSLVPTLATPGAFPGTPAAFAPSPLRRAGLPFGGDSPAPL
jgi:mediator of RNA polymerase II transcription subunit 6